MRSKWSHFALREGDLLISTSASLGRVSVVDRISAGSIAYTGIIRFRSRDERLHHEYLRAFLSSRSFVEQAEQMATGSVIKHFGPTHLKQMAIALPPISTQIQIAEIFDVLDDRIALLRETNATLEAIAQALFKSWFVDFDPVRAKMAGRVPGGIDEATAALFPDALEETELGLVPRGWSQRPVYEAAEFINGAAYKAFNPNLDRRGLPIIKIAELKAGVTSQTAYSDVEMPSKYLIETADVLFSWSGNPDTSIDTFVWAHAPAWLNQHIFRVIPRHRRERAYLLQLLRYLKPVFAELARNKQTTGLGHVTVSDLKRLTFVWPDGGTMRAFDGAAGRIQQRILTNEQQAMSLAALRDALLPRLISGQLRLPEALAELEPHLS